MLGRALGNAVTMTGIDSDLHHSDPWHIVLVVSLSLLHHVRLGKGLCEVRPPMGHFGNPLL